MSTWRSQLASVKHPDGRWLVGASFRGIAFFVSSSDLTGGRNVASTLAAGGELVHVQDMGKLPSEIHLEGYLLDSVFTSGAIAYQVQRDKLLAALGDAKGPGELVHPRYGKLRAACTGLTVREDVLDGGVATLSLSFLHVPLQAANVFRDGKAEIRRSAEQAQAASTTDLAANFDASGMPSFSLQSLRDDVTGMANALDSALAPVVKTTQELAILNAEMTLLTAEASALVRTPALVIDALVGTILRLAETTSALPKEVANAILDAYALPYPAAAIGASPVREKEKKNQLALGDAMRAALVFAASTILPSVEFSTGEGALAMQVKAASALGSLMLTATDEMYPHLVALRAALVYAIPGDQELARIQEVSQNYPIPALLLSHNLYGTTSEDSRIVERNDIKHPGFVLGNVKVLSVA